MLGGHDVIGPAVGLAGDDGDLGHGGLGIGKQQLGPVPDDAAVLLGCAGQEPRHVLKRDQRDVEGVAEADEPCTLDAGVDVQAAGSMLGIVTYK